MRAIIELRHAADPAAAVSPAEIGEKAVDLATMAGPLSLPVPPGFVIPSMAVGDGSRRLATTVNDELSGAVAMLERATGRRFGALDRPLLLVVRASPTDATSAARRAIVGIGLDEATTTAFGSEPGSDVAFATARRRQLGRTYREASGLDEVPDEPWEQLRSAITAMAAASRGDDGRSAAVIVQAMVHADRDERSARGVLLTRDPVTGRNGMTGELAVGPDRIERLVAGPGDPLRGAGDEFGSASDTLRDAATALERHHRDMVEITFAIESGRLWLLRSRIGARGAAAALRIAVDLAADDDFPLTREAAVERTSAYLTDPGAARVAQRETDSPVLAGGLAASPGIVSGAIATSAATALAMANDGRAVILVTDSTSVDDAAAIDAVAGILTTSGGLSSHASAAARARGLPAVVGATDLVVENRRVSIGARMWREGDEIAIDGDSGDIYGEAVEVRSAIAPEVSTLRGWARQLGLELSGSDRDDAPEGDREAMAPRTPEAVLRVLRIHGRATMEQVARSLLASPVEVEPLIEAVVEAELVNERGALYRLTEAGLERALSLLDDDREAIGRPRAEAALAGSASLDAQLREVVAASQMRRVGGARIRNDHSDPAYDASVAVELATHNERITGWLEPLVAALPRLAAYTERTRIATAAVVGGDPAWISSARVDSYRDVWLELRQDLVLLAGTEPGT